MAEINEDFIPNTDPYSFFEYTKLPKTSDLVFGTLISEGNEDYNVTVEKLLKSVKLDDAKVMGDFPQLESHESVIGFIRNIPVLKKYLSSYPEYLDDKNHVQNVLNVLSRTQAYLSGKMPYSYMSAYEIFLRELYNANFMNKNPQE